MAKVTLTDLASTNATSLVATINANNALIEAALEKTLSRDGTSPNTMEDTLDMNSERIINLPAPATATEPVRKGEFDTFTDALDSLLASNIEAVQALDDFTDIWLGAFSSDPAVDNDGGVLQEGALYFNTTTNRLKVYASGSWSTPLSGGGLSDADYGDITVSAAGTVMTIDNDVVTFAKMQNVAANAILARAAATSGDVSEVALSASNLLGRGSTGDVAAISLGSTLSMSGTTLNTTGLASTGSTNYFSADQYVVSGDSGATAGPILYLWRDSASPAASDDIGQLNFYGRNSVAAEKTYATLQGTIVDATEASEDAGLDVDIISAGTLGRRFRFEPENRYGYSNAGANQGVVLEDHWIKLAADYTLTSSVSEQKLFNTTTNGRLTLGTGTYFFETLLYLTTMSATSGNFAFDPIGAGTAVGASFLYYAVGVDSSAPTSGAAQTGSITASQQSVASILTAGVGTGAIVSIRGTFRVTTGGTIIPSITLATANAAVVKAGSYFRINKVSEENVNSVGAWD